MSRRRRSLLLLLLVLGLTLASLVAIAVRPVVLGLDLRGGVQVILQGKPTADSQVTSQSIQRSVDIINNRVNAFGVASPSIQTLGTDQISVQLPGVKNPDVVVTNLIKPAQLAFYDYENNVVAGTPSPSLYNAVLQAQKTPVDDPTQGAETLYAFDKTTHQSTAGPEPITVGETRDSGDHRPARHRGGRRAHLVEPGRGVRAQGPDDRQPAGDTRHAQGPGRSPPTRSSRTARP